MNSGDSYSTKQRSEGNLKYKAYNPKLAPQKNITFLTEAIKLYDNALATAHIDDDKYKAAKNIGLACEKMLAVYSQMKMNNATFDLYNAHAKKMASSFNTALINGKRVLKTEEYYEFAKKTEKTLADTLFAMSLMNKLKYLVHIAFLIQNHRPILFSLMARIARYFFNEGIFYLNNKHYEIAKDHFAEAKQIILIYYKANGDTTQMTNETVDEFLDVLESATLYIKITLVKISLKRGKAYLNKALNEQEHFDVDFTNICLDNCREALMNVSGE